MVTTGASTCARCGESIAVGVHFCGRCGAVVADAQSELTASLVGAEHATAPQAALLEVLRRATIGEYEILGELGSGGMATVYLAHDIALNRKVAIKVMSPSLLAGAGMVERFKREARTAASLSHPHIIPIHAVREREQLQFFVMKFVEGRALDSIIQEVGPLPIAMVQAILQQVGRALAYAHRRGIIHRDIKPANIMIDVDGWAVVTDFGIAKVAEAHALTMSGTTVGTPSYMSPEQCEAKELTGAADQYSVGVVAYEMLAGKLPFAADSALALMYAHANQPPPPVTQSRRDCPPELAAAIMRMLEKRPEMRWPDMETAVGAIGGAALAHDDPMRTRLMTLAATGASAQRRKCISTPVSPLPSTRRGVGETATPAPYAGKGLIIAPAQVTAAVGGAVQLTARLQAGGAPLPGQAITWASTNPEVATVSPTGLVTAFSAGTATITAMMESTSATAKIAVRRGTARQLRAPALVGGAAAVVLALALWRFGPWPASPSIPPTSQMTRADTGPSTGAAAHALPSGLATSALGVAGPQRSGQGAEPGAQPATTAPPSGHRRPLDDSVGIGAREGLAPSRPVHPSLPQVTLEAFGHALKAAVTEARAGGTPADAFAEIRGSALQNRTGAPSRGYAAINFPAPPGTAELSVRVDTLGTWSKLAMTFRPEGGRLEEVRDALYGAAAAQSPNWRRVDEPGPDKIPARKLFAENGPRVIVSVFPIHDLVEVDVERDQPLPAYPPLTRNTLEAFGRALKAAVSEARAGETPADAFAKIRGSALQNQIGAPSRGYVATNFPAPPGTAEVSVFADTLGSWSKLAMTFRPEGGRLEEVRDALYEAAAAQLSNWRRMDEPGPNKIPARMLLGEGEPRVIVSVFLIHDLVEVDVERDQ